MRRTPIDRPRRRLSYGAFRWSRHSTFASWVAHVKLFPPDSDWTWYAAQFDDDDLFLGLVDWWEMEMGYFSLSKLESVRRPPPSLKAP